MTKTDRDIYAELLNRLFGAGAASFDVSSAETSQVLMALATSGDFAQFRAAFPARLHRLCQATTAVPALRVEIVKTANLIAEKRNWDGAFAELAALDYLLADSRTDASELKLNMTVPATATLAGELGMQNANFDVHTARFNLSLDVKQLGDKIGGILRGIFKDVLRAKGIANLSIIPSYSMDDPYELYETNRALLCKELDTLVDVKQRPPGGASCVIPGLKYQFAWEAGVYPGISTYYPEEHAKNAHKLLFQHAKKFSKVNPSAIAFVHFPWVGERLVPIGDAELRFFKGMASHFFYDYSGSALLAGSLNRKFKGNILADDVARYLSGVIFLQDRTVTSKDPTSLNVDVSFLMNPAAHHPLSDGEFEHYLTSRGAIDLSQL